VVQLARFEAIHLHRQGKDGDFDLAVAQFLQQLLRLVLVQHQLQLRQLLAQPSRDQRQQVGADGRDQPKLEFSG
jgi:hypothetical protein